MAVRRLGVWCEIAANLRAEEYPLLEDVTKKQSKERD
jgi:hypothetical protein